MVVGLGLWVVGLGSLVLGLGLLIVRGVWLRGCVLGMYPPLPIHFAVKGFWGRLWG